MGWIGLLVLGAVLAAMGYRRTRLPARLPAAAPPAEIEAPQTQQQAREALIRLALTDRSELRQARLEAVLALGAMADPEARPALVALSDPGATYSNPVLRKAAREAIVSLDEACGLHRGQLSLSEDPSPMGALSTLNAPAEAPPLSPRAEAGSPRDASHPRRQSPTEGPSRPD